MKILKLSQLREKFLACMQQREYQRVKADNLISDAFPTTFNVSGGPNFADSYIDRGKNDGENSVTIQHCVRHWDYQNAGDGSHLSFFEMGVTTAFNGYSQRKVFQDHLSFILNHLGFPKESLHITVFGGGTVRGAWFDKDNETEQTWLSLGINDKNILMVPQEVPAEIISRTILEKGSDGVEREAFVSNAVEPIGGPRTEIFLDRGGQGKCEPFCLPGFCSCGRFIEFWTSVHYTVRVSPNTQLRDGNGDMVLEFEPLPLTDRIYAAGLGLERAMQILRDKPDIYGFEPMPEIISIILARLKRSPGKEDESHLLAIADHIRGLTFVVIEGAHKLAGKYNRSRRYEYRRYVRSLYSHFKALALLPDSLLIRQMVQEVIDGYLNDLPYREVYNEREIDPDYIAHELVTRMRHLVNDREEVKL